MHPHAKETHEPSIASARKLRHALGVSYGIMFVSTCLNDLEKQNTLDHSSMSISPTVVSMITRPLVGRAILKLNHTNASEYDTYAHGHVSV